MKHIVVTVCTAVLVAGLSLCARLAHAEGPRSPTMYTAYPNVSPEFAVPPAAKPAPDVRRNGKRSADTHRKQGAKKPRSWWS